MTILLAYLLVSCAVAMLWLDIYHMDKETKIYISSTTIHEFIDELGFGKKQTSIFKAMALLYNFFVLPWALIGIVYRYVKQQVGK